MRTDLQLTREQIAQQVWHAQSPEKTLDLLNSGEQGLDQEAVAKRRRQFGPNDLPEQKRAGLVSIFIRQFKDPLIYILLMAGSVSLAIGNLEDASFIFMVLLLNAVIGTVQEWKAESSAESLKAVIKIRANVRRTNQRQKIDARELVPGDIVLLESGNSVPADIRLLSCQDLRVDESLLTGESLPVHKTADAELQEDTALGDRQTLAHAGTTVMDGRALGVVCRIGAQTEVGRIAESLTEEAESPPLVVRLRRLTQKIAIFVLGAIILLAIGQYFQGESLIDIFFLAVALAVSAIPAGLPIAITVALSIATHRMAARNVIVRLLPAVEGLGSCTLIASDKTGTLTANVLTVKRLLLPNGAVFEVQGEGLEPAGEIIQNDQPVSGESRRRIDDLVVTGALCNEAEFSAEGDTLHHVGDTVDVALLVLAAKMHLSQQHLQEKYPRIATIPFESKRRFAASFHRHDEEFLAHVKGAAEVLLLMCRDVDREAVEAQLDSLAEAGYRVLALASGPVEDKEAARQGDVSALQGLNFLGLVGFIDPVRRGVEDAIQRCHRAGVGVRMITGDHPTTGLAIARRLHIAEQENQVMTGAEFKDLEKQDAFREKILDSRVFARVEPTQKTALVQSLQKAGHIVAVTGDGVNDAPALKRADIGVAMGQGGTDVARRAADLILTDDNFASIVNGIEEGRIAYDNVRKVTWLLISTGAAEILLFFLAFITGLPLPLNAVQLLWLNLVTNGIQDVALAFEKGEPGVLDRRPRPPQQPIFERRMIEQTLISGAWMGLVAFVVFYWLYIQRGWSEFDARNVLLLLMVLFENVHIFNCRSESRSLLQQPIRANPLLILTVIAAQGVHIAAMYIPVLNDILQVQPVSPVIWGQLLLLTLSIVVVMEIYKRLKS